MTHMCDKTEPKQLLKLQVEFGENALKNEGGTPSYSGLTSQYQS